MKALASLEAASALSALAAGILWMVSAAYGFTDMAAIPKAMASASQGMLEMTERLQRSTLLNAAAAIMSATAALTQCAVLYFRYRAQNSHPNSKR